MRFKLIVGLLFFALLSSLNVAGKEVRIEITATPQLTPLVDTLYLCGSFNNWNYDDKQFAFSQQPNGHFVLNIKLPRLGKAEFVVTRGSELSAEAIEDDVQRGLRVIEGDSSDTLFCAVSAWKDIPRCEGLSANVRLFDADFKSAQFPEPRRIWLYCPAGWKTSNEKYEVLLMQDGQNLFSPTTSFAGEWHLDENMDEMSAAGCASFFVVGIDNAGAQRTNEYTAFRNETHGGGNGEIYLSFLKNELLPALYAQLPLMKGPEHTAIGGSSLGALISIYALLNDTETFGTALAFSPSLWFNRADMLRMASVVSGQNRRIYFSCGRFESASLVNEVEEFRNALMINEWQESDLPFVVDPDGQHNERSWDAQTYKALLFLSHCADYEPIEEEGNPILVYPNPADDYVLVALSDKSPIQRVLLRDAQGKELAVALGLGEKNVKLAIGDIVPNTYTLVVESVSGEVLFTPILVK